MLRIKKQETRLNLHEPQDDNEQKKNTMMMVSMMMMIVRTMKMTTASRFMLYKSFGTRNYVGMVGSFAFFSVLRA
jgi:hypothetical protein